MRSARLAGALALASVSQLSAIALLATSAWLLSRAAEHPAPSALTLGAVAVRTLSLLRAGSRYGERLVGHDVALRVTAQLRLDLHRALRRRPADRSADGLSAVVADVEAVQELLLRVLLPAVAALVVVLACLGVVAVLLPSALLVAASMLLAALVVVPALAAALGWSEAALAEQRAAQQVVALELAEAGAELTVLGIAPDRLEHSRRSGWEQARREGRAARRAVLPTLLGGVLQLVAVVAVLDAGVAAVGAGSLARVDLAVVVLVTLVAFDPVAELRAAASAVPAHLGAVRRLRRLTTGSDAAPPAQRPASRELALRDVTVGPLHGVTLTVVPGESVLVRGPSGAGKTTLLDVLAGRRVPESGRACLGEIPLVALDETARAGVVTLAEQQPYLFATSLRDNLRLARPDADDERLLATLQTVGLRSWVQQLPRGLDTPAGELGTHLSGGQRVRLGVARALLSPAEFVLLDEPTEGLALAEGELLLREVLAVCPHRAVVVVSHRPVPEVAFTTVVDIGRTGVQVSSPHLATQSTAS